jgi:hypothetical protein
LTQVNGPGGATRERPFDVHQADRRLEAYVASVPYFCPIHAVKHMTSSPLQIAAMMLLH